MRGLFSSHSVAVVALVLSFGPAATRAADPDPAAARQRLDLGELEYPRHEPGGIFLGTGWSREDLARIQAWQRRGPRHYMRVTRSHFPSRRDKSP